MNYENEIIELKQRIAELEAIVFKMQKPKQIEIQEILPKTNPNRDKTKYMFGGRVCAKNRLVLSVIVQYVKDTNPTYEQLSKVFDKSLQGSLGVVEVYENAIKVSDAKKRYFLSPNEILHLNDGTKVVVCTQWGIFNIVRFIKQAQILGYKIETI